MPNTFALSDLTIPNNDTESNILDRELLGGVQAISIQAPAAFVGATVAVHVSCTEKDAADYITADFAAYQSPAGTDITIAPAKVIPLTRLAVAALRLVGSSQTGGAVTFKVFGLKHEPRVG